MGNCIIKIQKRLEGWGRSYQELEKIKYRTYTKNYTSDLSETFPKKGPNEFVESFYEFDSDKQKILKEDLEKIKIDLRSYLEEKFGLHSSGLSQKALDGIWKKVSSTPYLNDPSYSHLALYRCGERYSEILNELEDLGVITLEIKGESYE